MSALRAALRSAGQECHARGRLPCIRLPADVPAHPGARCVCRYDEQARLLMLSMPGLARPKALEPRMVRKNDTSAKSMNEWTGAPLAGPAAAACPLHA